MSELISSHAVIKALKAPTDPPNARGSAKIDIAIQAWKSDELYFPNKDELLGEWVLTAFLKDKGRTDNLMSVAYWTLLSDILDSHSDRPYKLWLSPMLQRLSVASIATAFYKTVLTTGPCIEKKLSEGFLKCMTVLWPMAATRMNLDDISDCLGSVLSFLTSEGVSNETKAELQGITQLVVQTFRQSFAASSNKKKTFTIFVRHHLKHWISYNDTNLTLFDSSHRDRIVRRSEVYLAGTEVLFSVDSLKGTQSPLEAVMSEAYSPNANLMQPLRILSFLFLAYVEELRKHSHAVFGSSSNQSQDRAAQAKFRDAAMSAFTSCYRTLRRFGDEILVWQSVQHLLQVADEANILVVDGIEKSDVLQDMTTWAVASLSSFADEADRAADGRLEAALRILCTLSHVDFIIIQPFLQDILSGLLINLHVGGGVGKDILRELVDFHSRTRSLPTYLTALTECISAPGLASNAESGSLDARQAYQTYLSSSVFSITHLESIAQAVRSFLTPGQTQETLQSLLKVLRASRSRISQTSTNFMDVDGPIDLSKTKNIVRDATKSESGEIAAASFALAARLLSVVLPSLPLHTLTPSTFASISSAMKYGWEGFIEPSTHIISDRVTKISSNVPWSHQIACAAALRIRHTLVTAPSLSLLGFAHSSEVPPPYPSLRNVVPELAVESFRSFFDLGVDKSSHEDCNVVVDSLMDFLHSNIREVSGVEANRKGRRTESYKLSWDGSSSALGAMEPGSTYLGALAVWNLSLDRWLPVIDELASPEQLLRFAQLWLRQRSDRLRSVGGNVTYEWALKKALRSARTWELPNLRDALLTAMVNALTHIHYEDISKCLADVLEGKRKAKSSWDLHQVQAVASTYEILLQCPRDYLTKNQRVAMAKQALAADLHVFMYANGLQQNAAPVVLQVRTTIRFWLGTVSESLALADEVAEQIHYLRYLSSSKFSMGVDGWQFQKATLELLAHAHRQIIHAAVLGNNHKLQSLCLSFSNALGEVGMLEEKAMLQFINILVTECPSRKKLQTDCVRDLSELQKHLINNYLPQISKMSVGSSASLASKEATVSAWTSCLVLKNWLGVTSLTEDFGRALLTKLVTTPIIHAPNTSLEFSSLGTQIFALILQECIIAEQVKREDHLELVSSAYIILSGRLQLTGIDSRDRALARFIKTLSVENFSFMLTLIRETLISGLPLPSELQAAVRLSHLTLANAPEGTSKISERHLEACLQVFSMNERHVSGDVSLSQAVLELIEIQCSEKPAAIRPFAVGLIWVVLAKFLAHSTSHTPCTHSSIFHTILCITSALIRLRRDLVLPTLPHLGMILRQLIFALRAVRTQLGAKQTRLVTNTLPWWVNPTKPLGTDEARGIARLLTTIQTKTIPRIYIGKDSDKEKQRAESIAHPFSKHAPYVLLAYIEAMNDPLCTLPLAVRTELEPGLFTLCDMISEHGRDAIMVSSLDAGGNATLKNIWREYEKQKYVGKG